MNRPTASIGTNPASTSEEDEWDFIVSGETGVCVEALPQDVRDSLRVKQAAPVPVEPEFAVSGETGVCVEAISASVRDILQTPKAAAPVAATIQQNEPEFSVTQEAPAQANISSVSLFETAKNDGVKKERYSDLRELCALLRKQ